MAVTKARDCHLTVTFYTEHYISFYTEYYISFFTEHYISFYTEHYILSETSFCRIYSKCHHHNKSVLATSEKQTVNRMCIVFTTLPSLAGVAEQQIMETGSNPAPWTAEEQKHLEQALKTFPASTPERWDRIATTIPTRSRKDCMRRYKVGGDT